MIEYTFVSNGPTATQNLGKRIGEKLNKGSIIALIGELGCGKTCFTKSICRGLNVPVEYVNSPTFTIVNEYLGKFPIFHIDLYRISNMAESLEIGVLEYLERGDSGVIVVEWAEKLLPLLVGDYLQVQFSVLSAERRKLVFLGFGERFCKLLTEISDENISYRHIK